MHHDISTKIKGATKIRGCKGIVHNQRDTFAVSKGSQRTNIQNTAFGIANRFAIDHFGLGADRGIEAGKFADFAEFPLWIADYSNRSRDLEVPKTIGGQRFTLWQFSETAQLPKETHRGEVDANVFYGSIDAFKRRFNLR